MLSGCRNLRAADAVGVEGAVKVEKAQEAEKGDSGERVRKGLQFVGVCVWRLCL